MKYILASIIVTFHFSCASMIKGNHDMLYSSSSVEGTNFYVDGEFVSQDSALYKFNSFEKDTHLLEAKKKGYETQKVEIQRKFNLKTLWNIVWLGFAPVGFLIDYWTDRIYYYTPLTTSVDLKPNPNNKEDTKPEDLQKVENQKKTQSGKKTLAYQYFFKELYLVKEGDTEIIHIKPGNYDLYVGKETGVALEPGRYKVTGTLGFTVSGSRSYSTYYSKISTTKMIQIKGGGDTVICGNWDKEKNENSIFSYHIPEEIAQNLGNQHPTFSFYYYPYFISACTFPEEFMEMVRKNSGK